MDTLLWNGYANPFAEFFHFRQRQDSMKWSIAIFTCVIRRMACLDCLSDLRYITDCRPVFDLLAFNIGYVPLSRKVAAC